jgi:hypothetical protein
MDLTREWWRLGGLLGIAFVLVFIVVGFGIQGESPMHNDDIGEIRAYWENDGDSYLLGAYLIGLASLLLFLPFLCAFRALLGTAEGGAQLWSRVAFAAGIIFLIMSASAEAAWSTLAFAAEELDDDMLQMLMYFDVAAYNHIPLPVGVVLLASSIVIWQTGVLWRWLAILGLIVGVAALLTPAGSYSIEPTDDPEEGIWGILGIISFLGLAIWLLLVSISMVMKRVLVSTGPRGADTASLEAYQPPA